MSHIDFEFVVGDNTFAVEAGFDGNGDLDDLTVWLSDNEPASTRFMEIATDGLWFATVAPDGATVYRNLTNAIEDKARSIGSPDFRGVAI